MSVIYQEHLFNIQFNSFVTTINSPRVNKFDVKQVCVKNIHKVTKIIDVTTFGSQFIVRNSEKKGLVWHLVASFPKEGQIMYIHF